MWSKYHLKFVLIPIEGAGTESVGSNNEKLEQQTWACQHIARNLRSIVCSSSSKHRYTQNVKLPPCLLSTLTEQCAACKQGFCRRSRRFSSVYTMSRYRPKCMDSSTSRDPGSSLTCSRIRPDRRAHCVVMVSAVLSLTLPAVVYLVLATACCYPCFLCLDSCPSIYLPLEFMLGGFSRKRKRHPPVRG